jgi:hypothetical protein
MIFLNKSKLLNDLTVRKESLLNQHIRDFGGGMAGRLYEHNEAKIWKEAIERGEYDMALDEVYVLMSYEHPAIVDFTFYTDKKEIQKRVDELNKLLSGNIFWYCTLRSSHKNSGERGEETCGLNSSLSKVLEESCREGR